MIDNNETIMYEDGWYSGYNAGHMTAHYKYDKEIENLVDWLEQKIYKLNNQDSIRAYQTVLNKVKRDFNLED